MGNSQQTKVCARFVLVSTTDHAEGPLKTLRFIGLRDDQIPDDARTMRKGDHQNGHIELEVTNPMVLGRFTNGKSYYVEFTEASDF